MNGGPGAAYGEVIVAEVFHRLRQLDMVALGEAGYSSVDIERIRTEMTTRIQWWRRLLSQHQPLNGGTKCPRCRTWGGWARRRWPCPVWTTAHRYLLAEYPPPEHAAVRPLDRDADSHPQSYSSATGDSASRIR